MAGMIGRQMRHCGEVIGRRFEYLATNGHLARCEVVPDGAGGFTERHWQYGGEVEPQPASPAQLEAFRVQARAWAKRWRG